MDSEPKCRIPALLGEGCTLIVSGEKKPDPEVERFVYLGQKMRASSFLTHLHLHGRRGEVSKLFAPSASSLHVCSGYHRGEKAGRRL